MLNLNLKHTEIVEVVENKLCDILDNYDRQYLQLAQGWIEEKGYGYVIITDNLKDLIEKVGTKKLLQIASNSEGSFWVDGSLDDLYDNGDACFYMVNLATNEGQTQTDINELIGYVPNVYELASWLLDHDLVNITLSND